MKRCCTGRSPARRDEIFSRFVSRNRKSQPAIPLARQSVRYDLLVSCFIKSLIFLPHRRASLRGATWFACDNTPLATLSAPHTSALLYESCNLAKREPPYGHLGIGVTVFFVDKTNS